MVVKVGSVNEVIGAAWRICRRYGTRRIFPSCFFLLVCLSQDSGCPTTDMSRYRQMLAVREARTCKVWAASCSQRTKDKSHDKKDHGHFSFKWDLPKPKYPLYFNVGNRYNSYVIIGHNVYLARDWMLVNDLILALACRTSYLLELDSLMTLE